MCELDCSKAYDVTRETVHEVWESPLVGAYKANFDAAFNGVLSRSGSGLVVRDSKGLMLASKIVVHSNVRSAFSAKALTCTDAVKICLDLGLELIPVEGDSLTVIKKCKSASKDKSKINPYIRDIKSLLKGLHCIKFHHVRRSTNKLVDIITIKSLRLREECYLFGEVPRYTAHIQGDEYVREPTKTRTT